MNHALIDHLNAEQIADEKREAEELQRYHGRISSWEARTSGYNSYRSAQARCQKAKGGQCVHK